MNKYVVLFYVNVERVLWNGELAMFEKIYMHSAYERKKNKVFGLKEYLASFVMIIPIMMLIVSFVEYLYRPFDNVEITIAFSVMFVVGIVIFGWLVMAYVRNGSKVYAISKDGKIYVLNMTKEAASYLSLNTAMQNMGKNKSASKPNIQAMKIIGDTAKGMLDGIDDSDVESRIENSGLCISDIKKVTLKKKKMIIYGEFGKKTKLVVPYMYNEIEELKKYFAYVADGCKGKFKFHKKTKEDILNEKIEKKPYKVFLVILGIVLWLFVYNFASDLNRYAVVKYNYEEIVAVIDSEDCENNTMAIVYEVNDAEIRSDVDIASQENYKKGDNISVYYCKGEPEKVIAKDSVSFMIKPFMILLIGLEVLALIIKILLKK